MHADACRASVTARRGKRRAKPASKPATAKCGLTAANGLAELTDLCKLLGRCLGRQPGQALLVPLQSRQS